MCPLESSLRGMGMSDRSLARPVDVALPHSYQDRQCGRNRKKETGFEKERAHAELRRVVLLSSNPWSVITTKWAADGVNAHSQEIRPSPFGKPQPRRWHTVGRSASRPRICSACALRALAGTDHHEAADHLPSSSTLLAQRRSFFDTCLLTRRSTELSDSAMEKTPNLEQDA